MRLGLRMGLNSRQGGGSALDPDARLYIAAVETALGTPIATALPNATSNPKRIISDFIKAEKADSRWSLHKRIYLPIYNNAAASAVDMVSRTSGTFQGLGGSVTHAAGYVQGDGTSGYFSTGVSADALGLLQESGHIAAISTLADSRTDSRIIGGAYQEGTKELILSSASSTTMRFDAYNNSTATNTPTLARLDQTGVIIASRNTNGWDIRRRSSSGVSSVLSRAGAGAGIVPASVFTFMALNFGTGTGLQTITQPNNGRFGAFSIGLGLSNSDSDGFSANLKTIYESLTGISLP